MNEPEPAFVRIAGLYAKSSRSGRKLHFGHVGKLRLYLFVNEPRQAKDCLPDYWLAIRAEDYDALKDKLPAALAVKAQEREP